MDDTRIKVLEAIARKRTVAARYNGGLYKLAPYQLFERHGDLFVSALNLNKVQRPDEDLKLGIFKLAGLQDAEVLDEAFQPASTYQSSAPRAEDVVVMSV